MKQPNLNPPIRKSILRALAVSSVACALPLWAAPPSAQTNTADTTKPEAAANKSTENWDNQFFLEIQQFERHMDAMFDEARQSWDTNLLPNPSFNSSVKLTQEPHQYVVRFALPERDVQNAKVTVENGTLHLTAKSETKTPAPAASATSKQDKSSTASSGNPPEEISMDRYEQLISLPGPVDASKIQIQRGEGVVTVTLPRTDAAASKPKNG